MPERIEKPEICYKLTTKTMRTRNNCQWKLGIWKETSGAGPLCTNGWLHAYTDPNVAVLLNPIHAQVKESRLFQAEGMGLKEIDFGRKVGYTKLRLVKELSVPEVTADFLRKYADRLIATFTESLNFERRSLERMFADHKEGKLSLDKLHYEIARVFEWWVPKGVLCA